MTRYHCFLARLLILMCLISMISACSKKEIVEESSVEVLLSDSALEESSATGYIESKNEADETSEDPDRSEHTENEESQIGSGEIAERADKFSRQLAKMGQYYDPDFSVLHGTDLLTTEKQAQKQCTVMIYMIGSNLESEYGAATNDLIEIENAGLDYTKNNLLICAGGARRWLADLPVDQNSVLDMSLEKGNRIVAQTDANADMGAPSTLSAFLNFSTEYYPADHYMLIFWDHGGGPIWGFGNDELFDGDSLLLYEFQDALRDTVFNEHPLDFVGFDACLMGCLESMSVWSEFADYYLGSEELEPGDGWDYSFLSVLNNDFDPIEVGTAAIDHYKNYYSKKHTDSFNPDLTLSLIDLSKISSLTKAMDHLGLKISENMSEKHYTRIAHARSESKGFGYFISAEDDTDISSYDLTDLNSLVESLENEYPDETELIANTIKDSVIRNYSNISNANGISSYFPSSNKWLYLGGGKEYSGYISNHYQEAINKYGDYWCALKEKDWVISSPLETEDCFLIQLTEEQLAENKSVYYSIFQIGENDYHFPVLTKIPVHPDENGCIRIPKDPEIVANDSGDKIQSSHIWPCRITEQDENRTVYNFFRTSVSDSLDTVLLKREEQIVEDIDILAYNEAGSNDIKMIQANSSAYGVGTSGKDSLDINLWESLVSYSYAYFPTYDTFNNINPYSEWQYVGAGEMSYPVEDVFCFKTQPVSLFQGDFRAQLIVCDASGGEYASDLMKLSSQEGPSVSYSYTENGLLTFDKYDDHAVLVGYEGNDSLLTVPAYIDGVPVTMIKMMENSIFADPYSVEEIILPDTVTVIGSYAFYHYENLKDITLPSSLQVIKEQAFSCTRLNEIHLPKSLEYIGKNAFSNCKELISADLPSSLSFVSDGLFLGCSSLQEITIDGQKNTSAPIIQLIDGVLYTSDGKKLIGYPGGRGGDYEIREGTEEIGYGAFAGASSLENITLPESLTRIGNYAFFNCSSLHAPLLPDSLMYIGQNAFGITNGSYMPILDAEIETIYIPSKLAYLGHHAFDEFGARTFEVDPQNPYYSVLDGSLTNQTKDCLYQIASDGSGTLYIPEGIYNLNWDDLELFISFHKDLINNEQDHVVIPATVKRFPPGVPPYPYSFIYVHCKAGSEAEQYCIQHNLDYDYRIDNRYTLYEIETDGIIWRYQLYSDHAALIRIFLGEKEPEKITIPSSVLDLPVTELGDGASAIIHKYDVSAYEDIDDILFSADFIHEIVIPDSVTTFQDHSLSNLDPKMDIDFPENTIYIGSTAFIGGLLNLSTLPPNIRHVGYHFASPEVDIDKLYIPASLVSIEPGAFNEFANLYSFDVDPENPSYQSIDGILYSKDGKELIAYPQGGKKECFIQEGTESIGRNAFEGVPIEKVVMPDSVNEIQDHAFSGCQELKEIQWSPSLKSIGEFSFSHCRSLSSIVLPDSVQTVGVCAFTSCISVTELSLGNGLQSISFGAFIDLPFASIPEFPDSLSSIESNAFEIGFPYEEDPGEPYTIFIGPQLTSISSSAFTGRRISAYEVDPGNPFFATVDGFLTDRSKERLIAFPPYVESTVVIPEGIKFVDFGTFYETVGLTDICFPDSVVYIDDASVDDDLLSPEIEITIHASKGSAAERFALDHGFSFVEE